MDGRGPHLQAFARAQFLAAFGLLACLLASSVASAGTLYRCTDKHGATAYTSTRDGYTKCSLLGNYPAAKPAAASAAPAGTPAVGGVEFRTAVGDGEPLAATVPAGAKPTITRGAVYKYEKNGITHYTNRRPAGQKAQVLFSYIETCFACGVKPGVDFNSVGLNLTAYADEVLAAAALHGVDAALIRAIMHAESAYNPNAVSRAGAQGLMQLIPATAARFGVSDPFTPAQNIDGGVSYLAWLTKRFDGDLTKVAAGYNAGEGAVDRYGGVPPYDETQRYVERVNILHQRYASEMAKASATASLKHYGTVN
ncbi:lytic transglycosylase domain-containing protein [Chiayiivirga flava]|uniref:Soluble lytic murein transglycosylase-like protein n=1 Tax=Chiayiivirga flava TaxID=659595 RepID=A0A7W8G173_9GAMM|nr:lytic transglycosylase domain-containing protein [Chiayiivirga flava]MBB5207365.1 soluble lytic murein transglycosylase-like protein [Chiayiivirga flava]